MKTGEKLKKNKVTIHPMWALGAAILLGSSISQAQTADAKDTAQPAFDLSHGKAVSWSFLPAKGLISAAHGTGVGNGGNSARDQYLAQLKRELDPTGTAVNAANNANPRDIVDWCGRVSATLIREKQRAMLQLQYDHREEAEQILIDALVAAAQSITVDPDVGGPMTKKLIDRALMDSQALDEVITDSGLGLTTKLNFLFGEISFIVDVSRDLDPPFYIPYRYRYGGCDQGCGGFDFTGFESALEAMAARELQFVVGNLTELGNSDGETRIFPLGDPRAFLKVAELTTGFVARDLRENLHAYAQACVIRDLESLSQTLSAYNLYQDHTIFPNDPWALSQAATEMNEAAERILANSSSCGSYGGPGY